MNDCLFTDGIDTWIPIPVISYLRLQTSYIYDSAPGGWEAVQLLVIWYDIECKFYYCLIPRDITHSVTEEDVINSLFDWTALISEWYVE